MNELVVNPEEIISEFETKFRDLVLTVISAKQQALCEYMEAGRKLPPELRDRLAEMMDDIYQEEMSDLLEIGEMGLIYG